MKRERERGGSALLDIMYVHSVCRRCTSCSLCASTHAVHTDCMCEHDLHLAMRACPCICVNV